MRLTLLILALAAGSMAVSAASAMTNRHDQGYKHAKFTHHHAIRPGFAFALPAAQKWRGCLMDDGQGRFRPCSWSAN